MDEENKEPEEDDLENRIEQLLNGALNLQPEQLQSYKSEKELRDKLKLDIQ